MVAAPRPEIASELDGIVMVPTFVCRWGSPEVFLEHFLRSAGRKPGVASSRGCHYRAELQHDICANRCFGVSTRAYPRLYQWSIV
jgi:hypothetical protein